VRTGYMGIEEGRLGFQAKELQDLKSMTSDEFVTVVQKGGGDRRRGRALARTGQMRARKVALA